MGPRRSVRRPAERRLARRRSRPPRSRWGRTRSPRCTPAAPSFAGSTSPAVTQSVDQAATTTTVGGSPNPSVVGQSVTFTATVAAAAPGAGTLAGSGTFLDGATVLGTGTLSAAARRRCPLGARRGGPLRSRRCTRGTQASPAAPRRPSRRRSTKPRRRRPWRRRSTPRPSGSRYVHRDGDDGAPGVGPPTGSVSFRDGGGEIGTATLAGGVATFTTMALAVGSHSITALYRGSASHLGAPRRR